MVGFYHFAYEYGLKDSIMGSNNLYFSWYALCKIRTAQLWPLDDKHTHLIEAVALVHESWSKKAGGSVEERVREKRMQREQLEKGADLTHVKAGSDGMTKVP